MSGAQLGSRLGEVAEPLRCRAGGDLTDRQLLDGFIEHGDEAAFDALVQRHSRGVWGVCRRVLPGVQDAEDAFQAVFLILARTARAIRKREALGSWLYGVAYRTALKARQRLARRAAAGHPAFAPLVSPPSALVQQEPWKQAAFHELQRAVDEEVDRLAEKYRAPFVLCCLEGMSRGEAARELGWKEGTVSGRLALARKLLQKRLARRGVSLSAALTVLALLQNTAAAATPAVLVHGTAAAVLTPAAGKAAAATLSPAVLTLADGLVKTMAVAKVKATLMLLVGLSVLSLAAGIVALQVLPGPDNKQPAHKADAPKGMQGPSDVWSIAVSQDGKVVASGAGWWDQPGEIGIWDVASRKPLRRFGEERGVASVAFSPDGKLLASGSWSGHVRLRDWAAGVQTADFEVAGVARVAFSPDGALLATVTERDTAQLWDPARGRLVADLEGDPSRPYPASYACVVFSPDGQRLIAGANDWKDGGRNQVIVWDLASKQQVRKLTGHRNAILCVACSPDGTIIASGGVDHTIRLWDARSGKHLRMLGDHQYWVESVVFTDGGKTLVSGSHDGTVRFWDVSGGKERARINIRKTPWRPREAPAGPVGRVRAVRFTPDGTTLFVGSGPRTLKLFDAVTHQETDALWNATPDPEVVVNPAPAKPREVTMDDLPPINPVPTEEEGVTARTVFLLTLAIGLVAVAGVGFALVRGRRRAVPVAAAATAAPFSFSCPGCDKMLKARPEAAGKMSKCPQCGTPVSVPKSEGKGD